MQLLVCQATVTVGGTGCPIVSLVIRVTSSHIVAGRIQNNPQKDQSPHFFNCLFLQSKVCRSKKRFFFENLHSVLLCLIKTRSS